MSEFKQVSAAEFVAAVGRLNVHPSIQNGPWPYVALWKDPAGRVFGRSVCIAVPAVDGPTANYFLPVVRHA